MILSKEQIWELNFKKQKKGIFNKELAEGVGLSNSTISHYFNFRSKISDESEKKIINYIETAKYYKLVKVEVD